MEIDRAAEAHEASLRSARANLKLPGEPSGPAHAIVQPSAPGRQFVTQGAAA